MANRRFQDVQALNREVKLIAGRVSVGSAGAPTLADGLGIASVEYAATGKYTITLDDQYSGLLYYGATYAQLAGTDQLFAVVENHRVTTSNKDVEIHFFDDEGNAEAPADGDEFSFFLMLRNSSVE
jgi:hypothetical protein